jgi:hypothetical protein
VLRLHRWKTLCYGPIHELMIALPITTDNWCAKAKFEVTSVAAGALVISARPGSAQKPG